MSKKIIIAEDSSVIQNIIKKILAQLKFDIHSVKNGKQVLDLLEKDTYDLILMDIFMPVMDGMACSKAIRSLENANKEIPILAITGNANNYTEADFQDAGINEFIPKPINYDGLVETVKRYTNGD